MAKNVKEPSEMDAQVEAQLDDGSSLDVTPVQQQAMALRSTVGEVQTRQQQTMQSFVDWLVQSAETTDEDQYAIMAAIVSEIRDAANPAEVLSERSSLHVRDILNVPLLLHGFDIREGSYEDSELNFYAAMTVGRQGTDTTRIVTCGATKVLAKLWRLQEFGEWPQVVWFTGKQTSRGFTAFDMVTPTV